MRRSGIVLLAAAVVVFAAGCGSGASSVRTARLSRVFTVQGQGHTLYVSVETEGVCLGNQRNPRVESIEVDEGPGGKTVITAAVRYFPREGGFCAGIGLGYERPIRTRRPVGQLTLYDGSESPPRRLGVMKMTQAEFRAQMRRARHNARRARRDREAH